MNVVFFKPGKPIGQLRRVLFSASHEAVFRDGNGNSDSGILLHDFRLRAIIMPNTALDGTFIGHRLIARCAPV
jgi:hypothetical protein